MSYSVADERRTHAHQQRAQLRGWPTEADHARALSARDDEIAQTHAALDQDDHDNGRAPRADNHAAAVRLTDRATERRAGQ